MDSLHRLLCCALLALSLAAAPRALAFGAYDTFGLAGGARWDASHRSVNGGQERSLQGGLRYSLQGGSFEAYRNLITWNLTPSLSDFELAVRAAFDAWSAPDPLTGLTTDLYFLPDFSTPVDITHNSFFSAGAEIDLFALTDAVGWNPGDPLRRAETYCGRTLSSKGVTLTSGTTNYPAPAILGADIVFNANPAAVYDLPTFQLLLTHEIGHALGLADVDVESGPLGKFIDDNYDPSSSASALATLTNSFALLINPFDPSASPLAAYTVADADPGVDTPGVDILMESRIPSALKGLAVPLSNDDFAARQFLYPKLIPEPAALTLLTLAGLAFLSRRAAPRA